MNLRKKIVLLFTCCISLVFLLLLLLTKESIVSSNKNTMGNLNTQLVESKSVEIGSWLNQRISEIRIISQSQEMRNMNMSSIKPFIDRLNDKLSGNYGNTYGTFAAGGLDGMGWVTDYQTIDVSAREYFKEAISTDKEYVISKPVISRTDEAPIILICYPVCNDEGEKIGFINGAIALRKLSEISSGIEFYNGTSWIMDKSGNIYSTTAIDGVTEEHVEALKPLISKNSSSEVGMHFFKSKDNSDKVVFYSSIPYSEGLSLCTMISVNELNKDTQQLIYTILYIWMVMLILSIILCIVFSRSITAPVNRLNTAMQSMKDGNLNIYCDVADSGNDEIANLAKSFNVMVNKIKFLMKRIKHEEKEKRSAELRVLQSQINPHFLYNTLDNLQWKAYDYNAIEISDMIEALSNFFRISLSKGKEFIPLKKEMEHIESYLFIQKKRYEDILDFNIDFDESLSDYVVIKLIVQPLVENAIYHGIKPKLAYGNIDVRVEKQNDDIIISVCDDGVGMNKQSLESLVSSLDSDKPVRGYGLYNVNQRIKLIYGKEYGITIRSELNKGTNVTICIPATKKEGEYDKSDNS